MAKKSPVTKKEKGKSSTPKVCYHYRPESMTLEAWQIALQQQAATKEQFSIAAINEKQYPGDYTVSNPINKSEYKVVFRGEELHKTGQFIGGRRQGNRTSVTSHPSAKERKCNGLIQPSK